MTTNLPMPNPWRTGEPARCTGPDPRADRERSADDPDRNASWLGKRR